MMSFSNNMKEVRQQRALTQTEVANQLHVSRQTISSWETGRTYPDILTLITIGKVYQISLDKLLREDLSMVKHYKEQTKVITRREKFLKWGILFNTCGLLLYYFLALIGWSGASYLITILFLNLLILLPNLQLSWDKPKWQLIVLGVSLLAINGALISLIFKGQSLIILKSYFAFGFTMGKFLTIISSILILTFSEFIALFNHHAKHGDKILCKN